MSDADDPQKHDEGDHDEEAHEEEAHDDKENILDSQEVAAFWSTEKGRSIMEQMPPAVRKKVLEKCRPSTPSERSNSSAGKQKPPSPARQSGKEATPDGGKKGPHQVPTAQEGAASSAAGPAGTGHKEGSIGIQGLVRLNGYNQHVTTNTTTVNHYHVQHIYGNEQQGGSQPASNDSQNKSNDSLNRSDIIIVGADDENVSPLKEQQTSSSNNPKAPQVAAPYGERPPSSSGRKEEDGLRAGHLHLTSDVGIDSKNQVALARPEVPRVLAGAALSSSSRKEEVLAQLPQEPPQPPQEPPQPPQEQPRPPITQTAILDDSSFLVVSSSSGDLSQIQATPAEAGQGVEGNKMLSKGEDIREVQEEQRGEETSVVVDPAAHVVALGSGAGDQH
ncbi:unnamed protein product, partial [Amoebophrya sp. A25]|eukprot:GSA25T00026028001.1